MEARVACIRQSLETFASNKSLELLIDVKCALNDLREVFYSNERMVRPYLNELRLLSNRFYIALETHLSQICSEYADVVTESKRIEIKKDRLRGLLLELFSRKRILEEDVQSGDYEINIRKMERLKPPSTRDPRWKDLFWHLSNSGLLEQTVTLSGARILKLLKTKSIDPQLAKIIKDTCESASTYQLRVKLSTKAVEATESERTKRENGAAENGNEEASLGEDDEATKNYNDQDYDEFVEGIVDFWFDGTEKSLEDGWFYND